MTDVNGQALLARSSRLFNTNRNKNKNRRYSRTTPISIVENNKTIDNNEKEVIQKNEVHDETQTSNSNFTMVSAPVTQRISESGNYFQNDISDELYHEELSVNNIHKLELQNYSLMNNTSNIIVGTYEKDYNILDIHVRIIKQIRKRHEIERIKLEDLRKRIINRVRGKSTTKIQKNAIIRKIYEIDNILEEINNSNDYIDYRNETSDVIRKYSELNPLQNTVTFECNKNSINEEDVLESNHRLRLIEEYLTIASKYVNIDITRLIKGKNKCNVCDYDLSLYKESDSNIICPECFTDITCVNMKSFNKTDDYEPIKNFKDVLIRFEGKQSMRDIQENIIDKLTAYFIEIGERSVEEIRNLPVNEYGIKEGTSLKKMLTALNAIGCNGNYKDVYLIAQLFWNWELIDLYEDEKESIINDYIDIERVYNKIESTHKSALNTQYVLFRILRKRGYQYPPSMFKIPKTPSSLQFYEDIWAIISEELCIKNPAWRIDIDLTPSNIQ